MAKKVSEAKKDWTVMVYMAADNFGNESALADLSADASSDLYEMMTVGSQDHFDVVVQIDWKRPKTPERLHILPNRWEQLQYAPRAVDMGVPNQLDDFLDWAKRRFSSKHTFVILWGHSFRYAFGYDGDDALKFNDLSAVFKKHPVDILGFDSCGMSAIESAYQLRGTVNYMLASEIAVPLHGWPYDQILHALTPDMEPMALGRAVVPAFVRSYPAKSVALTMLNVGASETLRTPLDALATSLAIAVGRDRGQREQVLSAFRYAAVPTGEPMVDLGELCRNLAATDVDGSARDAAASVSKLLAENDAFVVIHRHTGAATEGLSGVCAYAPQVGRSLDGWLNQYDQLELARQTYWPQLVKFLASVD